MNKKHVWLLELTDMNVSTLVCVIRFGSDKPKLDKKEI